MLAFPTLFNYILGRILTDVLNVLINHNSTVCISNKLITDFHFTDNTDRAIAGRETGFTNLVKCLKKTRKRDVC